MRQILCLSADPWRTIPTRTQQLMTRMRDAQVLLFEPPGKYSRQPGRRVRPGLTVCALPGAGGGGAAPPPVPPSLPQTG
ncbi:hypothetical protein M5E87_24060 [Flavonifractor plautii]|nr:hypothetical protein M5E87_24060 [Flavonifractor plautii]